MEKIDTDYKLFGRKGKAKTCENHTFCLRGLVENSIVFFAPLIK